MMFAVSLYFVHPSVGIGFALQTGSLWVLTQETSQGTQRRTLAAD